MRSRHTASYREHGVLRLPASVAAVEYLGADTVVACFAGTSTILARLPGRVVVQTYYPDHYAILAAIRKQSNADLSVTEANVRFGH